MLPWWLGWQTGCEGQAHLQKNTHHISIHTGDPQEVNFRRCKRQ